MKQTLQLRLGQHLTMTPQLQQAIRLLQLSTTELQLEVQLAIDSNLMLELADDDSEDTFEDDPGTTANFELPSPEQRLAEREPATADDPYESGTDEFSADDYPVDSAWDDVYDNPSPSSKNSDASDNDYENHGSVAETLHEHLLWQMRLTPFSDTDRAIATAIIDSITDDGYLGDTLDDILAGLQSDAAYGIHDNRVDLGIRTDEIEAVLHRIQTFDPVGVGARDLRECLLIQLQQYDDDSPLVAKARILAEKHLAQLGSHDYAQLMRSLKLTEHDLRGVIGLIQALNPRPGSQITASRPQFVVPDVYVKKHQKVWLVELNPDAAPRVRVNSLYANMIRRADNSTDNSYLKNHLQEARWFIKSLRSRNETLLKVATCIVERQREFLELGDVAMKPMVLHDVAEVVGMHESTVSRVTTQKYMHTPRGVLELKYFFSSHVNTTIGGECSATAIRAFIKKMVSTEEAAKPLSDSRIASILLKQGINVARRTVAKYRESLAIPPSNERKRLP